MIALFGQLCLYTAFFFALTQSVLPLIGYQKKNKHLLACARPAAIGQFILILTAYGLLTIGFYLNDFHIVYVAENSARELPLFYKLTAVWGGHEGSILFWILTLNIWTQIFIFTYRAKDLNRFSLILAIFGLMNFAFLAFLIFTSNPFLTTTAVLNGRDLNPLLQDPGFVIHPPMLYIGYVGFAAAFAITQSALIQGKLDEAWAHLTKQFAIAAWGFLTLGITLGSWWAYRVLGWGGFWFWDPVENASLLPWLAGTALIHILILTEKRGIAKQAAVILAIISFAMSMLGTFLVRSGVLISAHTFANDPARGVFLLLLLAIFLLATISLYLYRAPLFETKHQKKSSWRELGLLLNAGLLVIALLTILLGTLYPLILDALQLGTISIGPPYFNQVMMPILFCLLCLMAITPLFRFEKANSKIAFKLAAKYVAISFILAFILLWNITPELKILPFITLSLCFTIILSAIKYLRLLPAMSITHSGFAILIIGILLSSFLSEDISVKLKPGEIATLGQYEFLFIDTRGVRGENYRGLQAAFEVMKNQKHIVNLYPEKRIFTIRNMVMTKVDIHPGIFRDLYIALGEPLEGEYWSVRIYYKPFIRWIWFGGMIMLLGSIVSLIKARNKS